MEKKSRIIAFIITYLMLIPSITEARNQRKTDSKPEVGIIAHRGFWNCDDAGYARNSISALKCAQDAGFWGSEFDVNMTKDSVLIVFHDNNVNGKKIEEFPYNTFSDFRLENNERIPTVDDYLEQGKKYPETMLVYELKTHSSSQVEDTFINLTIDKLKAHGLLDPKRVMFISFSFHICQRLSEILPDFIVQYLGSDKKPSKVKEEGISGIDYNHSMLAIKPKWVAKAKGMGMSVNSWTVNMDSTIRKMINLGVDHITTDDPIRVREIIEEMNIQENR